ncbi:MAG TPA: hypothetical protein VKX39_00325 [Bryobacteraceae bacterium]|jgi:hypothetical protein|nr:hypothetical protein [Bryobacteraceae bacterium]
MTRRHLLSQAMLAVPAVDALANTPQSDRPRGQSRPIKITRVEATLLQKPLKERFWMAYSPIGGFHPTATRLILKLHTDAGITGYGEGGGSGVQMLRSGFAELVIGEDPFMVGKIWEKMFRVTYSREPAAHVQGAHRNGFRHPNRVICPGRNP